MIKLNIGKYKIMSVCHKGLSGNITLLYEVKGIALIAIAIVQSISNTQ